MENPVRRTTLEVVKKSKDVKINQARIKELAKEWIKEGIKVPAWPKEYHLKADDEQRMLDYLIILDAVNFCFWPASVKTSAGKNKDERWEIDYNGKKYIGYFAWSLALKKFFEENQEKGSLEYFSKIRFEDFLNLLQGGKNLLFLKKRWQIMRKVSTFIIKKYKNSKNFVESAERKTSVLVPKIYKELFGFDDISYYGNKKVFFLKRAQILCSEIWGAFDGKGLGHFQDLDYLTCFPDYKVPQALNYFGITEYSEKLDKKIRNKVLIPRNSLEEIEIRSATVWAVEYLKEALVCLGKNFYSFEIDWILWNKGKEVNIEKPFHLTKTIYY